MPRPQFSLKSLLWLMAVVAAFFSGSAWQYHRLALEKMTWEATDRALEEENRQPWQKYKQYYRPPR